MNIFSLLKSKKLAPLWEFRTRGILWRLFPAPGGLFVGEDRDEAARSVSFFCIDENTGILRWSNLQFEEKWWIGVEGIFQNYVFVHEFARPDFPEHKKIVALDLESGRTIWTNDDLRFMFALGDNVYASKQKFEGSLVYELDVSSGRVAREIGDQPDYVKVLRETAASASGTDVEFPRPLTEASESQSEASIMEHTKTPNLRGTVEFIEAKNYLVVGYYEEIGKNPGEPELNQHLKVIETGTGTVVYADLIAQKARGPAPDMFFARNDMLLYIKDRNTLKAIRLG